jgi:hypothetical protein
MKKHNISKAKACSKYSLWVVYWWLAKKYDHFADTIEKIKKIRLETLRNRTRIQKIKTFWDNRQFVRKSLKIVLDKNK